MRQVEVFLSEGQKTHLTKMGCALDVIHFLTKIRKKGRTEDVVQVLVNEKQGGDK